MKNIKRFISITLIVISTIFVPIVFGTGEFNLTVYEVNNTDNEVVGSGVISTNGASNIKIEWVVSQTQGYTYYEVMTDFGDGINFQKLNASRITSNSWTILSSSLPDEGTYHIRVDAWSAAVDGTLGADSQVVTFVVDETDPVAATGLQVRNLADNIITDTTKNIDEVKLTWDTHVESASTLLPQPYRIYYYIPNRAPEEITNIAGVSGEVANSIDVGPNGLALFDTLVTFQITVTDTAYNESVVAEASFTLDTKTPGSIRSLTMKDNDDVIADEGYDNDVTRLEWLVPSEGDATTYAVYYKVDDGDFITLAAGVPDLYYSITESGVTNIDGEVTFKVTSKDSAGNESPGVLTSFTLDTVDPVFDVTYINYETSNVVDIHSGVLNFIEKQTISVTNVANDIVKFSVSPGENFVSGDREDLQEFLRNLSTDSFYNIKVLDNAGNESTYTFTLNQAFPALPASKNLTITSLDLEDKIGVQSNVTITWTKSPDSDLDHYEVYVNGELMANDITHSGVVGSTIIHQLTLDTVKYGDVENFYEVRTYDDIGNYGTYNIQEHVTEDLVKPFASIMYTESSEEEITFTVELFDYNRVIDEVYAVLYKGAQFVSRIPITTGVHTYTFDNLDDGEDDYKIKIESDFDYNSTSFHDHVLNAETVYNIDTITSSNDVIGFFYELDATESSVSVRLETTKDSTANEQIQIKLYSSSGLAQTIDISLDSDDLTTIRPIDFSSLAVGENYQIRLVDGTDVLATANFFTQRDVPSAEFRIQDIEGEELSLKIILSDDDGAINLGTDKRVVRIYLDGVMIQELSNLSVGTNNTTFTNLDYNTEYEFRVYVDYDLENGRGRITNDQVGEFAVMTGKEIPTAEFRNIEVTEDGIVFDSYIDDDFNSIVSVKAVLYQGVNEVGQEILLNKGTLRNREFTGLDSLTNYRINLEIVYNLNDRNGDIINELYYGVNVITLKSLPLVDVSAIEIDNTSIVVSARIIDDNSSYENGLIKLFSNTQTAPVDMFTFSGTGTKTFTFSNLDPDTIYRIKVDAEIDLNDGEGTFDSIIYNKEVQTNKNIGIDIITITQDHDEVSFSAAITNYLSENIYAKLYQGENLIGSAVPMVTGDNDVVFQGLVPDTVYTIKVEYSNGTKQLWEYQILTESILELQMPTIEIVEQVVDGDVVTIKVEVNDPDDALTSDIVQIRICNEIGLCTVQEINVSILENGLSLELPYDTNIITVNMNYDTILQNGITSDSTDEIQVDDAVEPNPEPEPEPEPEPDDEPGFFRKIWNWFKNLFS